MLEFYTLAASSDGNRQVIGLCENFGANLTSHIKGKIIYENVFAFDCSGLREWHFINRKRYRERKPHQRGVKMKGCFVLIIVLVVLFFVAPTEIKAQKGKAVRTVIGTISKVEWGDNFYLTIIDSKGKKHTALCNAPICSKFNESPNIQKRYKGKKVKVTVGKGTRYDGGGNVMDKYDAFIKIRFLN